MVYLVYFPVVLLFPFLTSGRRLLDILDTNPLVLRLAVPMLPLFSLKVETEFC